MLRFLPELISLLLASVASFLLIYLKVPINLQQQVIAFLLALLIIAANKFLLARNNPKLNNGLKWLLFFTVAVFVQLVIISSGGIYSPFFVLLHIATLGYSLFFGFKVSLTFLALSLGLTIANLAINPNLLNIFNQDPATAILYLLSFVIVIPIGELLSQHLKIKDSLLKMMAQQVQLNESILENVSELVIITDSSLNIRFANQVFEKVTGIEVSEAVSKKILEVINLKDQYGSKATKESLSVDQALNNKTTHIVSGFLLYPKGEITPKRTIIRIQPVVNGSGQVDQITFIISSLHQISNISAHDDIKTAQMRYDGLINQMRNLSLPTDVGQRTELLAKIAKDIILASEIADHPFKVTHTKVDLSVICQQLLSSKRPFAQAFNARLEYKNYSEDNGFNVSTDPQYLILMLQKLIDIAILTSLDDSTPRVEVGLSSLATIVDLYIVSSSHLPEGITTNDLFMQYYVSIDAKTNLHLGSGLEGVIASSIAAHLDIPIQIGQQKNPNILVIKLTFKKV